jgi:pyridoxine 5-phosphate synthase
MSSPIPVVRRLGVNIDHVATLRQARQSSYPDPVAAAMQAELAGADQITCHIRGDRRHIQDADLWRLRDGVQTLLNVEMATTEEMIAIGLKLLARRPGDDRRHRVTLVPERPGEVTTEGGLDVCGRQPEVAAAAEALASAGILVSLFVDPDVDQISASGLPGVDMIEINTASFAEASHSIGDELARLKVASLAAQSTGLEVAAGHGLTHHNLPALVAHVPEIIEYNIGHSLIGRAVFVGLDRAVRDLVEIIRAR